MSLQVLPSSQLLSTATVLASALQNGTVCALGSYRPQMPALCPSSPLIPPFPLAAIYPPQQSPKYALKNIFYALKSIFKNALIQPLSLFEAIEQNNLPLLRSWLDQDDEMLAQHLSDQGKEFSVYASFVALAKKASAEGNIPVVLMLLDRFQQSNKFPRPLIDCLEGAVSGGKTDLVFAILRRGYSMKPDSYYGDALEKLFLGAIEQRPQMAIRLLGEDLPFKLLKKGMEKAIEKNHPELLTAFLAHHEADLLIPIALEKAVKANRLEFIKEIFQRGVSEKEALEALWEASANGRKEIAHFIASHGSFYRNDRSVVSYLIKTGFLPHSYQQPMIAECSSKQTANILEAYLESGQISDRNLLRSWEQLRDSEDRFNVLRAYLVDRRNPSLEMQTFLLSQIALFSPSEQELLTRIAIWKDHPKSFQASLMEKAHLSSEQGTALAELQSQRSSHIKQLAQMREAIVQQKVPSPSSWNGEEVQKEVMQWGAEILEFCSEKKDPRFKFYFSSSLIGEIQELPHLILKSLDTSEEARERFKLMERVRRVCQEKNLTHIHIPNAIHIEQLPNTKGEMVPVNLIVEEKMPIAGHQFYEVREMLEALNQDERTREMINRYFEELTILVCETGLTDLKPTNVPLLQDGSGLALVDSSMQKDSVEGSLYAFQADHSLADWLAPVNLEILGRTLDAYPGCPKDIKRSEYEKNRKIAYERERQIERIHLQQYGRVETAPITLSEGDLEGLDPLKRKMCEVMVKDFNQLLQKQSSTFGRRQVLWKGFGSGNGRYRDNLPPDIEQMMTADQIKDFNWRELDATHEIFDHLIRKGKIVSAQDRGGFHGFLIQC